MYINYSQSYENHFVDQLYLFYMNMYINAPGWLLLAASRFQQEPLGVSLWVSRAKGRITPCRWARRAIGISSGQPSVPVTLSAGAPGMPHPVTKTADGVPFYTAKISPIRAIIRASRVLITTQIILQTSNLPLQLFDLPLR